MKALKVGTIITVVFAALVCLSSFTLFDLHEQKENSHIFINHSTDQLVEIPLVKNGSGIKNYEGDPSGAEFSCVLLEMFYGEKTWNIESYRDLLKKRRN